MILYAVTIFLSAFLLFQVQPLIAKIILPWFGGSAAVWTVCMLFFQLLLLAGYVYSHAYVRLRIPARRHVHIALLVLAAATLPLAASAAWKPQGGEDPTWRILGLLATSVGLPYFVLSTTGPLVQAWYARSHEGAAPYRLFALSNLGSMLALVSYPLAVEPLLKLGTQAAIWSAGFVLFALACAMLAWRSKGSEAQHLAGGESGKPGLGLQALWAGLACCASVLLLAFTGHMTLNIAAIPFLWVLPLALYLLSFVLCFEASGWYRRWLFLPMIGAGLAGVCVTLSRSNPSIWTLIPLYSATLFAACMVCHGELARSKPHPQHLTGFYLMLALGGAVAACSWASSRPRCSRISTSCRSAWSRSLCSSWSRCCATARACSTDALASPPGSCSSRSPPRSPSPCTGLTRRTPPIPGSLPEISTACSTCAIRARGRTPCARSRTAPSFTASSSWNPTGATGRRATTD